MLRSLCALAAVLLLATGCEKPAAPPSNSVSTTPAADRPTVTDHADDLYARGAADADAPESAPLDSADAAGSLAANTPADEIDDAIDAAIDEDETDEEMDDLDEPGDEDPFDDSDQGDAEDDELVGDDDEGEPTELAANDEDARDEDSDDEADEPADEDEAAEDDEPKTAQELVQEAQAQANAGDLDGAVATVKKATEVEPENMDVLATYCNFSRRVGMHQVQEGETEAGYAKMIQAGQSARKLLEQEDERTKGLAAECLFYEAAAHAQAEDADKALASLKEALDAGFEDHETLLAQKEFASLKDNEEYQELIAPLVVKAEEFAAAEAEAAVEDTKTLLAVNEPFPFEFELTSIEGETITNESLKGHVAIVDFWGTWCPPCRKEIPHFIALQDKYREQGLMIVGINCREGKEGATIDEKTALVAKFIEANGINYTCALSDDLVEHRIPSPDGFAYPTTLFLDRSGTVRAKIVGLHSLPRLEAIVVALLAESGEEGDAPQETETAPDDDAEEDAEDDADADAAEEDADAEEEAEADTEE